MFAPANQSAFSLTVDGRSSDLKVLAFKGEEAISQPYCFDIELVSEQPDLIWKTCCTARPFSPSIRWAMAFTGKSRALRKVTRGSA